MEGLNLSDSVVPGTYVMKTATMNQKDQLWNEYEVLN